MDVVKDAAGTHTDEQVDTAGPRRAARRGRGPLLVGTGILLVAAVATVGALGLGGGGAGAGGAAPGRSGRTVPVTRGTLTDQTEIDGQLGHGPEVPFEVKARGTVTWLPQPGTTVRRGGTVLRVDDRPVVLLYGSLPMYRDLGMTRPRTPETDTNAGTDAGPGDGGTTAGTGGTGKSGGTGTGTSADTETGSGAQAGTAPRQPPQQPRQARQAPIPMYGMDVKQFETNLSALGYTGFTVDETYSALTAAAVRRWQRDLGLPQTGRVDAGDVVYAPGPVRIAGTTARVGAEATGTPLSYTSTSRMVTVNAPAADTGWARRGTGVTVELPDGRAVRGTVARVGRDATASGSSGGGDSGSGDSGGGDGGASGDAGKPATVSVVITFAGQDSLGRLESGPVTVRHVVRQRKGVLTVPVAALVALAEGGYGLETADGKDASGDGGSGRFVTVRTGLFADGRVEVSGPQVHEGMKVRIPQ
jgi:Putative peptidoglycan binding domain